MNQPVFSNGAWWAQNEEGAWVTWDDGAREWRAAATTAPSTGASFPYSYAPSPGAYAYPPRRTVKTNPWAISSLVVGILWIWWVGATLAVLFGFIALREIRNAPHVHGGKGLAIAGITLGGVWIGLGLIGLGAHFIDLPS